jgi:hypothetical protein
MKREVVQDFLNLPGIAGLALIDGRSRPYFYGIPQSLNYQQREALSQGIKQVVETTPSNFERFEFQFTGYRVYIHKLEYGVTLVVLVGHHLTLPDYEAAVAHLKQELRQDAGSAIAAFRLTAGTITLNLGPNDPSPIFVLDDGSEIPTLIADDTCSGASPSAIEKLTDVVPIPNLSEVLAALNQISLYTSQYLGNIVVGNKWKSTRPPIDWLQQFQIDRSAQITFSGTSPPETTAPLTEEQHGWICEWVHTFIQRCSAVIREFACLLQENSLTDRQKAILRLS